MSDTHPTLSAPLIEVMMQGLVAHQLLASKMGAGLITAVEYDQRRAAVCDKTERLVREWCPVNDCPPWCEEEAGHLYRLDTDGVVSRVHYLAAGRDAPSDCGLAVEAVEVLGPLGPVLHDPVLAVDGCAPRAGVNDRVMVAEFLDRVVTILSVVMTPEVVGDLLAAAGKRTRKAAA